MRYSENEPRGLQSACVGANRVCNLAPTTNHPSPSYNRRMTLKEKILFHQVHPAKLATDSIAAIISLYFFWQQELIIGLVTHFTPPPIASGAVIHFANLEPYKNSRLGAYLVRYMTPT